jgi:DNA segregation ATPase FtsK/SpoIIIE-like protein
MKSQVMLSRAKVKQIKEFNSLVKKAKQHAEVGLTFVLISLDEDYTVVAIRGQCVLERQGN